ncbi:hypothetical protein AABM17_128 [Neisseria musculi]|uniref:Uncharacterized protein n=1 Tax=Neisseria musculi TaxID=1815583 RepID=A0A7H1M875_9NEIS|nr:hypothetical protein H7A79_0128 [Neisseria musculi]
MPDGEQAGTDWESDNGKDKTRHAGPHGSFKYVCASMAFNGMFGFGIDERVERTDWTTPKKRTV